MKFSKEYIFPSVVNVIDDILEEKDLILIKDDIIESSKKVVRKMNWQSNHDTTLHQKEPYINLGEVSFQLSKKYIDDLLYNYDSIYISSMWSNILKPGESFNPHTHSNNFVSGVFYVEADEHQSPALGFLDPRPQAGVFQPDVKNYNVENSTLWNYPAKTNRMILFPSWLQHYVPVNCLNKNRISIAFNVMLKGQIGRPEDLQSAEF